MAFVFATFAAVFLLLNAASCAPAGLQDACADVRNSSMELNRIAKIVSVQARNGSKDLADFSTSLVWMRADDMCDPETLKLKSTTCTERMFKALTSYNSVVETVARFPSCSEFVSKVKPALDKLHEDMSRCVKSKGVTHDQQGSHTSEEETISQWEKPLLCQYTLDRLFSFSILTARVFAVGDPANHATEGSAQKCM
eukprot:superscaffoldBa00002975_g15790